MPYSVEELVRRIHASPTRLVLAVAGGGSRAIPQLMEVPGASRTVLEACVPYSEGAMTEWLGGRPDQFFCAEPTARAMAMAAFLRACRFYAEKGSELFLEKEKRVLTPFPLAGVACTASLATDRPKRGPHRAHVAIQTAAMTVSQSVELQKGRRGRAEEEQLVACLVLNAVAEACGLEERLTPPLLAEERFDERRVVAPTSWQDLLAGRVNVVRQGGAAVSPEGHARAVFPGAFHPIHAGHRGMARIASERLGVPVEFEISILNVDKPPLDYLEIERRTAQFSHDQTVWLTRAATFEEKSRLFQGATFVVGADTLRRIADPCYYGSDAAACQKAIERIVARGCRFLVFGRREESGFVGLSDLDLPPGLRAVCQEIPSSEFREDISSTEIRRSSVF